MNIVKFRSFYDQEEFFYVVADSVTHFTAIKNENVLGTSLWISGGDSVLVSIPPDEVENIFKSLA